MSKRAQQRIGWALVIVAVLCGVAVVALGFAAIWVGDHRLQMHLSDTAFLLFFVALVSGGGGAFLASA